MLAASGKASLFRDIIGCFTSLVRRSPHTIGLIPIWKNRRAN